LKVLVEKIETPDASFNSKLSSLKPAARVTAVNERLELESTRLLTFEFSRDRKSMSVLVNDVSSGLASLLVKGAPESVLDRCAFVQLGAKIEPLNSTLRDQLNSKLLEYGAAGLRTLAFAYLNDVDSNAAHYKTESSVNYINFEQNMIFVGFVGMLDPPRPEVALAIAKCRSAGIRVICITGDNKNTAETICRQIGIFDEEEKDLAGKSYTGREFDALDKQGKIEAVMRASLFSRTEPGHKLQIVDLLQNEGLVVAMVSLLSHNSLHQRTSDEHNKLSLHHAQTGGKLSRSLS
jgi:Ca2+ transporting ATPase